MLGLPGSEQELFHRTVSRSSEDTLSEIGVFGYLCPVGSSLKSAGPGGNVRIYLSAPEGRCF